MNCTRIKRIIDEADRPDVFPLEAAGHLAGCPDCQSFADERARLRELTGSVAGYKALPLSVLLTVGATEEGDGSESQFASTRSGCSFDRGRALLGSCCPRQSP